jgi:hypothetical protein
MAVTSWVSAWAPTSFDRDTSAAVFCLRVVVLNVLRSATDGERDAELNATHTVRAALNIVNDNGGMGTVPT